MMPNLPPIDQKNIKLSWHATQVNKLLFDCSNYETTISLTLQLFDSQGFKKKSPDMVINK